jgi:hypothetical protein
MHEQSSHEVEKWDTGTTTALGQTELTAALAANTSVTGLNTAATTAETTASGASTGAGLAGDAGFARVSRCQNSSDGRGSGGVRTLKSCPIAKNYYQYSEEQFGQLLGINEKTMREVRHQLAPQKARRGGAPTHRR